MSLEGRGLRLAAPLWSSTAVCSSTGPASWALRVDSARGSQGEWVPEPPAAGLSITSGFVHHGTENVQIFLFLPKRGLVLEARVSDSRVGASVPRQALAPRGLRWEVAV